MTEGIEVARVARAAKEVIKGKGKCGRKLKSAALEPDEPEANEPEVEAEPEVASAEEEVVKGSGKRVRKRKSATQEVDEPEPKPQPEVARIIEAPGSWRAPVARLY